MANGLHLYFSTFMVPKMLYQLSHSHQIMMLNVFSRKNLLSQQEFWKIRYCMPAGWWVNKTMC